MIRELTPLAINHNYIPAEQRHLCSLLTKSPFSSYLFYKLKDRSGDAGLVQQASQVSKQAVPS